MLTISEITGNPPPAVLAALMALVVAVLFIAVKIGRFVIRLIVGVLAGASLAGALWWLLLRP